MKRLKIGFNARTLSADKVRGWTRYTVNLLEQLNRLDVEIVLFSDRELNEVHLARIDTSRVEVVIEPFWSYSLWEQVLLPRLCTKYGVDLLHSPINYGVPCFCPVPRVLTVHDAISEVFHEPNLSFKERYGPRALVWKALSVMSRHAADKIITVSEHARRDIEQKLSVSSDKIEVIYEAADPVFLTKPSSLEIQAIKDKYKITKPYFFYVGGWEERKNIDYMLSEFASAKMVNIEMVLAGGSCSELEVFQSRYKNEKNIRFLGWIEDRELPSLFSGARGFIYPSLYEGFGLQMIEAFAMECPVVASNRTSLPELLQNDMATFDPCSPGQLKSLLLRFQDEVFYNSLREHSKKRAIDFSWQKTAQQTLSLYHSVLGTNL